MRIRRLATALVLTAAMPLAAAAGPAKGQTDRKNQTVTVGDFAVMLAAATGKAPNLEAGKAHAVLARTGVPIGKPGDILKEGKLAEILGFYGVKVETRTPDQPVTLGKAETALLAASGSLAAANGSTPSEPDQTCIDECLKQRNHGMCVNCCKACPGTTATRCAHFCPTLNKESPSEPLP